MKYNFEEIESCEIVGQFDDEYVYDIEVDDETHTFIADDILVHNSLFVSFDEGMKSCNWTGSEQKFIEIVSKNRLEKLFDTKLRGLAKKYKVDNLQEFELENINESILHIKKKKYIKHTIWEDGRQYGRLEYIAPKGVDLIKKGTPKFAREKVIEIVKYLFDNASNYTLKDILAFITKLRKEFELVDVDDIVQSTNIRDYHSKGKIMDDKTGKYIDAPGVVSDKEELVYAKGTYHTRKAAGLYNHLLYQHRELQNIYNYIEDGNKVKIYPCIHKLNDKFCYNYGQFPKEFAPQIDYDELFKNTISIQVNTYMEALKLPTLNKRLKIIMNLF